MNHRGLHEFEANRQRLLAIGYRFLGSWSDAEDLLQDTYLRWLNAEQDSIQSPQAWLTKVLSRLALDQLKSVRHQREQYIGQWLPEPIPDRQLGLEDDIALRESISIQTLNQLERLNASERIVYVLHQFLHYGFDEIAVFTDKTPANCRKIASRARVKLQEPPGFDANTRPPQRAAAHALMEALEQANLPDLLALLSDDAVLFSDGGGQVSAIPRPMQGRNSIANFLVNIVSKELHGPGKHRLQCQIVDVNGAAALLLHSAERVFTLFSLQCQGDEITQLFAQRNPDKLVYVERSSLPPVRQSD